MEKTLILSLENHQIYYVTDNKAAFYIAVPYQKYDTTDICIELRDDTKSLTFDKDNLAMINHKLSTIYSRIDNYNVSLVVPVLNIDFLNNLRMSNDEKLFAMLDKAIAKVINYSYMTLSGNNIKVDNQIIMINNEKFKIFNNWFVGRYGDRCKYMTLMEIIQKQSVAGDDNLNKVDVNGVNFVVGKEHEEEVKEEAPKQHLELDSTLILDAIDLPEDEPPVRKEAHQAGYVSYYLLGVFSIAVSLVILYLLL